MKTVVLNTAVTSIYINIKHKKLRLKIFSNMSDHLCLICKVTIIANTTHFGPIIWTTIFVCTFIASWNDLSSSKWQNIIIDSTWLLNTNIKCDEKMMFVLSWRILHNTQENITRVLKLRGNIGYDSCLPRWFWCIHSDADCFTLIFL